VLDLAALPTTWTGYDLIISVSMLEYVPRAELAFAMRRLRERLAPDGQMLIVITRRNPITRLVIEKPWHAQRYTRAEFGAALGAAGCTDVRFTRFPARYFCLSLSNHVALTR
jgi:cyclopropane fatty-acyl-phospholipid synthase-like methyltransferase